MVPRSESAPREARSPRRDFWGSALMITLASDHVERAEGGNDIGDHEPGDEPAEPLRNGKTRGSDAHAIRRTAPIGDDVEAELAVAPFGIAVRFAGGHFDALHHDLEVLNRPLDGGVHVFLR